jgi:hypothetical protein
MVKCEESRGPEEQELECTLVETARGTGRAEGTNRPRDPLPRRGDAVEAAGGGRSLAETSIGKQQALRFGGEEKFLDSVASGEKKRKMSSSDCSSDFQTRTHQLRVHRPDGDPRPEAGWAVELGGPWNWMGRPRSDVKLV